MPTYVTNLLTATAASKAGSPTPTTSWQWLRNSTAIESATASSYTVSEIDIGQLITVRQTETNFMGTAPATSAAAESVLPFNPIALFAPSKQGVWYDPSDLTTMFTDRAGTTPVTTPGQTVGLRLDKSKGLVLGSELRGTGVVSTIGSPGTLATFNTSTGAGSAYRLDGSNSSAVQIPAADGRTYLIDVEQLTGSLQIRGTGPAGTISVPSVVGRQTYRILVGGSEDLFFTTGANASSVTFTVHSVKELAGNHAVAPTDAARPTYGIEPKTGRRNLLRNMTQADTGWVTAGTTPPTLAMSQTYLGESCTAVTFTSAMTATYAGTRALQSVASGALGASVILGNTYRTSYHLSLSRALVGAEQLALYFTGSTGLTEMLLTADNTSSLVGVFERRSNTANSSAGASGIVLPYVYLKGAMSSNVTLYINKIQIEDGSTATNYQRVGTAFDVTEAGVPTVHYVQYDGSDDSFSTSSIDFSATDKMSVFAGVRKLSDAAQGVVVELSASTLSNNGTFNMQAPSDAGFARYRFTSKGTISSGDFASGYAAPISSVLTGLGDISGDTSTLRVNGTQAAQATTDQGTGNYGNYPLYIGRRNNATLPFNGRDYGMIVVGKTASASEITATESWLAAKTSGVTI